MIVGYEFNRIRRIKKYILSEVLIYNVYKGNYMYCHLWHGICILLNQFMIRGMKKCVSLYKNNLLIEENKFV